MGAPQATKAPQGVKAPQGIKAPQATKAPAPNAAQPTATGTCADTASSFAKDDKGNELGCKELKVHCADPQNGPTIQKMCPASCGTCGGGQIGLQGATAPQGVKAP